MGWSIGWDDAHGGRDIGYGVVAYCDHPDCNKMIDRGLTFVCADSEPRGGDGCGLYFCWDHKGYYGKVNDCCERCRDGLRPFPAKADHPLWTKFKMADESWAKWRQENGFPEPTEEMVKELERLVEEEWR